MNQKESIEKATADAFIKLYNNEMGTFFIIEEHSDAPDIRCKDEKGNAFNFEITMTEDRPKDIQAALGRSNSRSIDVVSKNTASCLHGNVTNTIVCRIQKEMQKDYGCNVALVVRDSSPVGWDWNLVVEQEIDTKIIPEIEAKIKQFPLPRGFALERALISTYGPTPTLRDSEYFNYQVCLHDILNPADCA